MLRPKERILELDIFRSLAIMAVVVIHTTSETLAKTEGTQGYYPYLFINMFSKFAVPVFIFLSAFVLFYNYLDKPLGKSMLRSFYTKRLLYILLPYLLISLGYFVLDVYLNGKMGLPAGEILQEFGMKLLTGKAHYHLYYMIIMLQLYLAFPLFLWWFQKKPSALPYAVLIGLAIQWLHVYLYEFGFHWPEPGVHRVGLRLLLPKGSLIFSYMSFFLLGALVAAYYNKLKAWLVVTCSGFRTVKGILWIALWAVWLAAGILHVNLYYWVNVGGSRIHPLWFEFMWNFHSLLSCIVLMQASYILYRHTWKWLAAALTSMGACSFGIYLVHPALLYVYRKFPAHGGTFEYAARTAGGWAVALGASWLIVYVAYRYIPWSWIVFGSGPKRKQKNEASQQPQIHA